MKPSKLLILAMTALNIYSCAGKTSYLPSYSIDRDGEHYIGFEGKKREDPDFTKSLEKEGIDPNKVILPPLEVRGDYIVLWREKGETPRLEYVIRHDSTKNYKPILLGDILKGKYGAGLEFSFSLK